MVEHFKEIIDHAELIIYILTALATTAGVIVGWTKGFFHFVFNFLIKKIKELRTKNLENNLLDQITKLYSLLNSLLNETSADRVLLFRVHNGGGILKFGSPTYITAMADLFAEGRQSLMPEINKKQLDYPTMIHIQNAITYGNFDIEVDKIEESSTKMILKDDNIKRVKYFFIHADPNQIIILSLYKEDDHFIEVHGPFIEQIRTLFSNKGK